MTKQIPVIEHCCDKEAYAFFGLAAYLAQVLEQSAINLVIAFRLPEKSLVTQETFELLNENLEKQTFGRLLRACRTEIEISDNSIALLEEVLDLRNMLIHSYFRDRAEEFISESGRVSMMEELQSIISKFHEADDLLEEIYLPLLEKYDVTEEYLTQEFEKMMARAKERDEA